MSEAIMETAVMRPEDMAPFRITGPQIMTKP